TRPRKNLRDCDGVDEPVTSASPPARRPCISRSAWIMRQRWSRRRVPSTKHFAAPDPMPYRFARRRPLDRRAWLALVALLLLPACAAPVPFVGGSGGDPVVADGIPKETVGAPVLDDAAARADSLDGNGGGAGTGATAEAGTARVDEALDSIIAERVDSPPVVPEPPRPWAEVTL